MATQYEWVDVYSLKRWGDPSTMGSIGGGSTWNPDSNQGFQWNTEVDFSSENGFYFYLEDINGVRKNVENTTPSSIHLRLYENDFYNQARYYCSTFMMCEEFDRFSNLSENNFTYIQGTFTASYKNWAIYFVLENGNVLATDRYPDALINTQLRLPIHKLATYTDKRFLGRFLIYNLPFNYSNPFYDSTGNQGYNMTITPKGTSTVIKDERPGVNLTYYNKTNDASVLVQNVKFLNK